MNDVWPTQTLLRHAWRALASALLLFALAFPARAAFEGQFLFGPGAVAMSLGGNVSDSRHDTLSFLSNPALLSNIASKRYILSYSDNKPLHKFSPAYKHTLLGLAGQGNGALTLIFSTENKTDRNILSYSRFFKFDTFNFGVTASGMQYKSGAGARAAAGSGFTMDLGVAANYNEKLRYGLSLQNFISNIGDVKNSYNVTVKQTLPQVISFGATFDYKPNMRINGIFRTLRQDKSVSTNRGSTTLMSLGVEYDLPNTFSARLAPSSNDAFTPDPDKLLGAGFTYRGPGLDLALGVQTKSDAYSSPVAVTAAWKPKGDWERKPPPPPKPAEPPKYEPPLPSSTKKTDPGPSSENKLASLGLNPEKEPVKPKPTTEPAAVKTPPSAPLEVVDFTIHPKAIMLIAPNLVDLAAAENHWSRDAARKLAGLGFFGAAAPDQVYEPGAPAGRDPFYRMLFVNQLRNVFAGPMIAEFKTPGAATAEVFIQAPDSDKPAFVLRRTFGQSGKKQLILTRDDFDQSRVSPGKYKLIVNLADKDGKSKSTEDYITVIDTSIGLGNVSELDKRDRILRVSDLRRNLSNLNIDLEYLSGLVADGPISRMEALRGLMQSLGVQPPKEFEPDNLFNDIDGLSAVDRAFIFLASRGLDSLRGFPLMTGFPGGQFRPDAAISQAEAVALIARALPLNPDDFQPPWRQPLAPQPAPVSQNEPPTQNTETRQQNDSPPTLAPSNQIFVPIQKTTPQINKSALLPYPSESRQPRFTPADRQFILVAASFTDPDSADELIKELRDAEKPAYLVTENMGVSKIYHVALGVFATRNEAEKASMSYKEESFTPVIIESVAPSAKSLTPAYNGAPNIIPGKLLPPPSKDANPLIPWKPKDEKF